MKKGILKRLIATALVTTMTVNTCVAAYAEEQSNSNIMITQEQQGFEAVIQCESFDIQCGSSNINGEVSETADIATLHDGIMSMLGEETVINEKDYLGDSVISNETDIYSVNMYNANAGTVNLSEVIVAENNIGFGASEVNGDSAILYSKNGDINFYCGSVDFTGIIYAPNGTVRFEGSNININGVVIAKEVIVRAGTFDISRNEAIAMTIEELAYIRNDMIMELSTYYDEEQEYVVLEWEDSEYISDVEIYVRYVKDDENVTANFEIVNTVTETSQYVCEDDMLEKWADYMIVALQYSQ